MSITSVTPSLTPQFLFPLDWSFADLQERLGDIPAARIRLSPPPGYATVDDVQRIGQQEDRLCELEYGVLVEKPMGWYESILATLISNQILNYLQARNLGQVLGEGGSLRILPGIVKIPDVSFISWSRFPKEQVPRLPIPALVPDLVVEVLSESNTEKEMAAKLKRYFEAGVLLVWYINPKTRSAVAYPDANRCVEILPSGELDGGDVLPGFSLSLSWLFQQADRQAPE